MFTLRKVGTAHSTFTCITTQETSLVKFHTCAGMWKWTHTHTHLCFIPSGIWRKVSGLSLVYLWLCIQASLSSLSVFLLFPPSLSLLLKASLLSLFFLIVLVFLSVSLPSPPWLATVSPPPDFSHPLPLFSPPPDLSIFLLLPLLYFSTLSCPPPGLSVLPLCL